MNLQAIEDLKRQADEHELAEDAAFTEISRILKKDSPREFWNLETRATWRALRLREKGLVALKTALTFEAGTLVLRHGRVADLGMSGSVRFCAWLIKRELDRVEEIDRKAETEASPE